MGKVIMLINALPEDASPDELDVLNQAAFIEDALHELGYDTMRLFLDLNLELASMKLRDIAPSFVFNIVESVDGSGKLIHLGPALLEHIKIPYTGCHLEAMYVSTNKILTKTLLRQAGLPTPEWFDFADNIKMKKGARYIAKPLWEDASVGISDENVLESDPATIRAFLEQHSRHHYFFEEYIEGREFNISILGGDNGPEVLPIAEILFQDYPENKPHIVGYDAKWKEGSFEYSNTVRVFGLEEEDPGLANQLEKICISCWQVFGLKGYARIDFRLDEKGRPWILEVNANPCLSSDAGFYAAATKAGYTFKDVVKRICEDVWN